MTARAPSAGYKFGKFARRNKVGFAMAATIAAVLILSTGISVWQARLARKAEAAALASKQDAEAKAKAERAAREESQAITKFLTGVFKSPDPARNGRTITVAETLDTAVKSLDRHLVNQPARRAKLQTALGSTYDALGLWREAIPLQEKVRDYCRVASGPEHPDTLWAMASLAISYEAAGRRDEALNLEEQVLALRRKVLGPEHPDTLGAMNNLAISYFAPTAGTRRSSFGRNWRRPRRPPRRLMRHRPPSPGDTSAAAARPAGSDNENYQRADSFHRQGRYAEAEQLAAGKPEILQRISEARATLEPPKK